MLLAVAVGDDVLRKIFRESFHDRFSWVHVNAVNLVVEVARVPLDGDGLGAGPSSRRCSKLAAPTATFFDNQWWRFAAFKFLLMTKAIGSLDQPLASENFQLAEYLSGDAHLQGVTFASATVSELDCSHQRRIFEARGVLIPRTSKDCLSEYASRSFTSCCVGRQPIT